MTRPIRADEVELPISGQELSLVGIAKYSGYGFLRLYFWVPSKRTRVRANICSASTARSLSCSMASVGGMTRSQVLIRSICALSARLSNKQSRRVEATCTGSPLTATR